MAGRLSFDVNQHDAARRLWMIGLSLARATEDPRGRDLTVFLLYDLTCQAVRLGRPDEALKLVHLVVDTLVAAGLPVHGTTQPSRAPLGELARHGIDTYRGMALACLCAADRHHQLEVEIKPALRAGEIVVCDRYLASSLVLQGLDGLSSDTVWQLNHGVYRPDLAVILNGDPQVIDARLRGRGGHSRFERAEDNSDRESGRYVHAVADLQTRGWPVVTLDCTTDTPDTIAARIVSLIHRVLQEKSPACR